MPATEETYRTPADACTWSSRSRRSRCCCRPSGWSWPTTSAPGRRSSASSSRSSATSSRRPRRRSSRSRRRSTRPRSTRSTPRSRRPKPSADERAGRDPHDRQRARASWSGTTERLDTQRRFKKAELDSKRSLYDGMIDRGEEREARAYLTTVVAQAEQELDDLSQGAREGRRPSSRPRRPRRRRCSATSTTSRKRRSG